MNREERNKFRNSKQWKQFRQAMHELYEGKDALTGKKLHRGWHLHHLDMNKEHYDLLLPENFIPVNKRTHELLHICYDIMKYKGRAGLINVLNETLQIMESLSKLPD